jgi:hypothetical protein
MYLCQYIYRKISTHPLIINPPISHPLTGETIYLERYKLYNGIDLNEGLGCSIFPHSTPTDGLSLPRPTETSSSVLFETKDINNKNDTAIYHIGIKIHYSSSILGVEHPIEEFKTVPQEAVIDPSHELFTNNRDKTVRLDINVASYILSDYLEIMRLAILDQEQQVDMPFIPRNLQVPYFNLKSGPWEKDRNVYYHEAEMLIRYDTVVSKGWRERFNIPTRNINLNIGTSS